jgi:hypothetical protein
MGAYHQMGHHSENLLEEPELAAYRGAILSPVNYTEVQVAGQVHAIAERSLELILDPQLYYPTSQRGCLRTWDYFPADVDTADLSSEDWWHSLTDRLLDAARRIRATSVCSPAVVPRSFDDAYFARLVEVANHCQHRANEQRIDTLQTVVVHLPDLAIADRALLIASIVSRCRCPRCYLIFLDDTEPRRERTGPEELKGAMRLIAALEQADVRVLVGFSSSDMVLWKAAGATHCATGKFFNLRRFTPSRFEEPSQGGGALPYWFEQSLMAFLRESDVVRLRQRGLLQNLFGNPISASILTRFAEQPGAAWLGLSWRQFMYWFADAEQRIQAGATDVRPLLRDAETKWRELEDLELLMEEPRNDGTWLRPWRRALAEYAPPSGNGQL